MYLAGEVSGPPRGCVWHLSRAGRRMWGLMWRHIGDDCTIGSRVRELALQLVGRIAWAGHPFQSPGDTFTAPYVWGS